MLEVIWSFHLLVSNIYRWECYLPILPSFALCCSCFFASNITNMNWLNVHVHLMSYYEPQLFSPILDDPFMLAPKRYYLIAFSFNFNCSPRLENGYLPFRILLAIVLCQGLRDGFICWEIELYSTNRSGESRLITSLVRSNKKLHSDFKKFKVLLLLSYVIFFVIIGYKS